MSDSRPGLCRNRVMDEGKPYPKSGCLVEGCGGALGQRVCEGFLPPPKRPEPALEMTMRDHFAGLVISGMYAAMVNEAGWPDAEHQQRNAMIAYSQADALLAARATPPAKGEG